MRTTRYAALLKTLWFSIIIPGTVTIYFPLLFLAPSTPATWSVFQLVALLVIAAGFGIYLRCAWDFAVTGLGTPAPIDPPRKLVIHGLYLHSRNPMYVGILSILLGEAIFFESVRQLLYAGVIVAMFQSFILFYEEPHLRQTFGEAYIRYCKAVPRWVALRSRT
jgi:protein-S-isoprenylcysteine O-methyltransferase Ste14